jgi:hypothetical protein
MGKVNPSFHAKRILAALLRRGAYTAVVANKSGSAGTALIEVYNFR